jgi:hypothetical protein
MEKTNNVIPFPQKNKRPVPNETDITLGVNMIKHNHINETLGAVIPLLFTNLELAGFDLGSEDDQESLNIKEGALIVEAIRALLCKIHGMDHPFINLAEALFHEQSDGAMMLVDNLSIVLKEKGEGESH